MSGALWRLFCRLADRARVRQVPLHGLVPYGTSPLTPEACLDPACVSDPTRFYPVPASIKPDVWETIDEADGVEVEALEFASAAPFGLRENDRVTARFYRPAGRPARFNLLVLPGIWRQDQEFEDRLCRQFARNQVSCALLTLPFHWSRSVPGAPSGAYFLSADPMWTSAAFRQAVIDARGLLGLLRGRDVPVGVLGFSLGGIVAHMLMAIEPAELGVSAFAGGDTAGIVWDGILTQSYRRAMEARGVTLPSLASLWATGDPIRYARRRRPSRMLMLNARYDLCVPFRFTRALWEALGEPPIHWLPAGHITGFLFRGTIVAEVLKAMGFAVPVPASRRFPLRLAPVAREMRWAA